MNEILVIVLAQVESAVVILPQRTRWTSMLLVIILIRHILVPSALSQRNISIILPTTKRPIIFRRGRRGKVKVVSVSFVFLCSFYLSGEKCLAFVQYENELKTDRKVCVMFRAVPLLGPSM
jgi:hypothetical protein